MAMQSLPKSIYHDEDYYFKSYSAFLSHITNMKEVDQLLADKWKQISRNVPSEENPIQVLLVGAGDGYREMSTMEHLLAVHPEVHIAVIEPVETQLKLCKENGTCLAKKFPGLSFEWHNTTFEDYISDRQGPDAGTFHIVVCFHALYLMDLEWAIDSMYNMARKDGVLVITMATGDTTYGIVGKLYAKLTGCRRHHADNALAYLETKAGKIERSSCRDLKMDITECFKASEEGTMVLDFMIQRMDFIKSAPNNVKEAVINALRENSEEEDEDGVILTHVLEQDLILMKCIT